jgi:competence protein ComEA
MNLLKALLISFVFVGVVNAADPAASAKPAASAASASASAKPAAPATPIDINTADKAALSTLKGIGPAKAEAILKYRQEKGPFKSIDDLKNVNGIGDKVFEAIKSDVTVGTVGGAKPADKPVEASAKPAEAQKSAAPAEAKPAEKASAKAEEKKPATPAPKM